MLTETVLCKILSNLTGRDVYEIGALTPDHHIRPILIDMDPEHFGPRFARQQLDWTTVLGETERFMQFNGIEGGLDYNREENPARPSEQFIFTVIVQLLAVYWLYSPRLDEVLKNLDSDDHQAFCDAVLPFKNSLSEALAKNYANLTKERKSFGPEEPKKFMMLQREIQELTNTIAVQRKTMGELNARVAFVSKTVEDRDKEIRALKEIEDILISEKGSMTQQKRNIVTDYEKLQMEYNFLQERMARQEDESYKALAMVEKLENSARGYKDHELFFENQKKSFEELNEKLKALENLKTEFEDVKAANEEKKQFIIILHAKNKDLQTQMVNEMQKIITLENKNMQLEANAQELQSMIAVLENQIKTIKNENMIYRNHNKNLLLKDYIKDDDMSQSDTHRTRTEKSFGAEGDKVHQLNKKLNELKNENLRLRAAIEQAKQQNAGFVKLVEENAQLRMKLENIQEELDKALKQAETAKSSANQKVKDTEVENQLRALLASKEEEIKKLKASLQHIAGEFDRVKSLVPQKRNTSSKFFFKILSIESKSRAAKSANSSSVEEIGLQTDTSLMELFEHDKFSMLYSAFSSYTNSYLDVKGEIIARNIEAKKQLGTHYSMGKMFLST